MHFFLSAAIITGAVEQFLKIVPLIIRERVIFVGQDNEVELNFIGGEREAVNQNFSAICLNVNKSSKSLLYQQVLHIFTQKKYVLDETP